MPSKTEKARRISAGAACELIRRSLPSRTETISAEANPRLQDYPLFPRIQALKWFEKWKAARQAVDALHAEVFALPPIDNPFMASHDEEPWKKELLKRVDRAIFAYVGVKKEALFEHSLIRARISAADFLSDRYFFNNLSLAIRRGVGPHGQVPYVMLSRAGAMLERGMSWAQVYDALVNLWSTPLEDVNQREREAYEALHKEWKIGPPGPTEFYKQLKRHHLIKGRGKKI